MSGVVLYSFPTAVSYLTVLEGTQENKTSGGRLLSNTNHFPMFEVMAFKIRGMSPSMVLNRHHIGLMCSRLSKLNVAVNAAS